jgi:hypothetical protein
MTRRCNGDSCTGNNGKEQSAKKNAAAINRTLGPRPTLGARKARGQQLAEVQEKLASKPVLNFCGEEEGGYKEGC